MKKNFIKYETFLQDFKYLKDKNDKRLTILYLHLYIEYLINSIYLYAEKDKSILGLFLEKLLRKRQNIKFKMEKLIKNGIIPKMYFDITMLMIKLRNQLAHLLKPDMKMIENWINQHEPPIESRDNKNLIKTKLNRISPWNKIEIYTIPTIFYFYKKLYELDNEYFPYDLKFIMTPQGIVIDFKKNNGK